MDPTLKKTLFPDDNPDDKKFGEFALGGMKENPSNDTDKKPPFEGNVPFRRDSGINDRFDARIDRKEGRNPETKTDRLERMIDNIDHCRNEATRLYEIKKDERRIRRVNELLEKAELMSNPIGQESIMYDLLSKVSRELSNWSRDARESGAYEQDLLRRERRIAQEKEAQGPEEEEKDA